MTDHTPEPCGCRVEDDNEYATYTIIYCPTHAAAPDLLAALERIGYEFTAYAEPNLSQAIEIARAAISAVKSEEGK